MIVFPNAKINLGLDIIEKREDGYHNISSCFYPVPLTDALEMTESEKFAFSGSGLKVPGEDKNNLVVRAYQLLKKDFDLPRLSIHLHKIIPPDAGLGGGSSDATFTLNVLNTMFELYLDDFLIADYAFQLGSDCPFFVYNKSMIVEGRGELLYEIEPVLTGYYLSVIKPDVSISTREAYKDVIPLMPECPVKEIILDHAVETWKDLLKNDFERGILKKYPALAGIKKALYDKGALYASMTGSGSAIYGIFREDPGNIKLAEDHFSWTGKL